MSDGSEVTCFHCTRNYASQELKCPHCGAPNNPDIPSYPRFSGRGWFLSIWILFVMSLIAMLVLMFAR
ncbi:MAG: hypothetical protein G3M78_08675 [Candidatus Nitrohelix vancouverensis]|uniref:Uncharacterized protein n=1 Tax=Candidatus Nitrohelix vancouverensis TaxID=2705534 RepID=A0A7T0G3J8_9BACT|nr:MAG: hypothetical protein G3M78_08675 [Candidatus Nitrohelix vancouverensis]